MQHALRLLSPAFMVLGIILIWSGQGCLGCAAMLCGGVMAGLRQAAGASNLGRTALTFTGFLLFLVGTFTLYVGQTCAGIVLTLVAAVPWHLGRNANVPGSGWVRFFSFACLIFWGYGTVLLFRGKVLDGGLLLGGSVLPWYAMESITGGRIILSLSLLGEILAWCGAAAAIANQAYVLGAVLIALFLISRLVDDYLLVRKGHMLSEDNAPLSFRAYLNLDSEDARYLRRLAQE